MAARRLRLAAALWLAVLACLSFSGASARADATSFPETPSVLEFGVPTIGVRVPAITFSPDGSARYVENRGDRTYVGVIRADGSQQDYQARTWDGSAITWGSDGAAWFLAGGSLWRMSSDGSVSPGGVTGGARALVTGPDGQLWLFEDCSSRPEIVRYSTSGQQTGDWCAPGAAGDGRPGPVKLTIGADGNVWFTEWDKPMLGEITPDGRITEHAIGAYAVSLVAGPDGAMWWVSETAVGRLATNGSVTTYPLPAGSLSPRPTDIASADHALWVTETGRGAIARVSTSGSIQELATPDCRPAAITTDAAGRLWWTDVAGSDCGARIVTRTPTGQMSIHRVPAGGLQPEGIASTRLRIYVGEQATGGVAELTDQDHLTSMGATLGTPTGFSAGPDRTVWMLSDVGPSCLAEMSDGSHCPNVLLPEGLASDGRNIAPGSDGTSMWWTDHDDGVLVQLRFPPTDDVPRWPDIHGFSLPSRTSGPNGVTAGPDDAEWFTEDAGNAIGRITATGDVTEFALPIPSSHPEQITLGPDGALWFTQPASNTIGRITTDGAITEFAMPIPDAGPYGIVTGPDGYLWVTDATADAVTQVSTTGVMVDYPLPTANAVPHDIAIGPDGNLWFTEHGVSQIGRITLKPQYPSEPQHLTLVPSLQSIDAHWDPPQDSGGAPITSYLVRVQPPDIPDQTVPTTSTVLTGLRSGVPYTVSVFATNSAGLTGPGVQGTAAPYSAPGAPTSLAARAGPHRLTVSWMPPRTDGGTPIATYQLTVNPAGQHATVSATARSYQFTSLPNDQPCTVSVQATNAAGTSRPAVISRTPHTAPQDFTGDGVSDIAVFRPSDSSWHVRGQPAIRYGTRGDIPVPGDYTGTGREQIAVFRPSDSSWHIEGHALVTFGRPTDQPL